MKQEIKSALKKTAKIAGVTCLAAGSIAVLTSGMALKAIGEGGKYSFADLPLYRRYKRGGFFCEL